MGSPDTASAPPVLLVDDDRTNIFVLENMLEGLGLDLHTADSGRQALEILEERDFALVLLDVMMPDLDGFAVAEAMRQDPRLSHVPIIFITAVSKEDRHVFRGYETGAVDYLIKPFEPEVLRGKVRIFVDLYQQQRAVEEMNRDLARTQELLRRQRDFAERLLDKAPAMVLVLDTRGRVVRVNAYMERVCACTQDEVVGADWFETFIPSDNRDEVRRLFEATLDGEDTSGSVNVVVTKDGGLRYVQWHNAVLPGESGEPDRVLAVGQDITDQERGRRKLAEVQARLAAAVEQTPAGILIAEAGKGGITMANSAAGEILGQTGGGLLDQSILDDDAPWWFLRPDGTPQEPGETPLARAVLHRESVRSEEVDLKRGDGSIRTLLVNAGPIRSPEGGRAAGIAVFTDITGLRHMETRLEFETLHDPLTGLANRALCQDRVARAVERSRRRQDAYAAVVFLDIDRFKVINDSLGHATGDRLLRAVADRLRELVRRTDTLSRFGSDEFVILMEDMVSPSQAIQVIKRLRAVLTEPFHLGGEEVRLTASFGACLSPFGQKSPQEVLQNANIALHRAKEAGGDGFKVFNARMGEAARRVMTLENELRRAVSRNELFLEYQPYFRLRDESLAGFETLVRWNHPERGIIGPAEFIPLAEETGLIEDIGRLVLEQAAGKLGQWHRRFPDRDLSMSVNVSARQFARPELVDAILSAVRLAGVEPQRMTLELTESAIMVNPENAIGKLGRLKRAGFRISVDDFGTGYSSMSYLQRFPLDVLKIDLSFVREMHLRPENREIVRTIINLAHNLGLSVVAEGVEKAEHKEALAILQCEYAQGYLFARPLSEERALELLESST